MPDTTTAKHPSGLKISFTEFDHRYVDDYSIEYTSTTTLVHNAFVAFDAEKTAKRIAHKRGTTPEALQDEWERNRQDSSDRGTRMHQNFENQIKGNYDLLHTPRDEQEKICFRNGWFEIEKIKQAYNKLETEKLIFTPRFKVAGSIDLLASNPKKTVIFDFKNLKELKYKAYRDQKGIHPATMNLPDCNFYHYALQLSIYQQILLLENYIHPATHIERWLLVHNKKTGSFTPVFLPFLQYEATLLLAYNATSDGLEDIPF